MIGYKSDMVMLPEHGVGAVILTNADTGSVLANAFGRRLLRFSSMASRKRWRAPAHGLEELEDGSCEGSRNA